MRRGSRGPGPINSGKNFVLFRETELLQLGEDQFAVYLDFKGTTTALDEPGSQPVLIIDGVLQTCSVWQVVSLRAVFDCDIHQSHSLLVNSSAAHRKCRASLARGNALFVHVIW